MRLLGPSIKRLTLITTLAGLFALPLAAQETTREEPAQAIGYSVDLTRSGAGSLYMNAEIGGVVASFLVDTGAAMVTVDKSLFKRMRETGNIREVRRVAARLANNRLQVMTVYEVAHFQVGEGCELGPLEVAVMDGAGRNLLGLSALDRAAPFTIHTSPPAITLSGCSISGQLAALN